MALTLSGTPPMHRAILTSPICLLVAVLPAAAQTTLPVVEDVEWRPFRDHCRQLLKALDADRTPLSAEAVRSVQALLDREPDDPKASSRALQKMLDPHCLLGVSINPESRVKAA